MATFRLLCTSSSPTRLKCFAGFNPDLPSKHLNIYLIIILLWWYRNFLIRFFCCYLFNPILIPTGILIRCYFSCCYVSVTFILHTLFFYTIKEVAMNSIQEGCQTSWIEFIEIEMFLYFNTLGNYREDVLVCENFSFIQSYKGIKPN